ncbi:hypothetical protein MTR_7g078430 [Medicago truncatula]|uniref:Uncharacterized protein n=1 Tax=Medicago truncatula TaxID=3880 RepID=G7L5R5_MEDTR|nr:hypothetical protein MTR_7g078430 [Medicago truncatula]
MLSTIELDVSLLRSTKDISKSLIWPNEDVSTCCILPNQLYRFSHRIPSYKMSVTNMNAFLRCSFELDQAPLSIETCQLAGK